MVEIIIENSPKEYQRYLSAGDLKGNKNHKIDNKEEAAAAAQEFYRDNPSNYQKFLNYLEDQGYRLRPSLANEGTLPSEAVLNPPAGRKKIIFTTHADYSFDIIKRQSHNNRDRIAEATKTSHFVGGVNTALGGIDQLIVDGREVVSLYCYPHPSKKKSEPNPVVSGIGYDYTKLRVSLMDATHVQIQIKQLNPEIGRKYNKGYIILEIYDADSPSANVRTSKDPKNRYLPKEGVDLFKIRIPVDLNRKWQTLTVPLAKFIDWNRKRTDCIIPDPGVNEDIGDGLLNPQRGESFQFQIVLEAEDYDKRFCAHIGQHVSFVKYEKIFLFDELSIVLDPPVPGSKYGGQHCILTPFEDGIKIEDGTSPNMGKRTIYQITPNKVEKLKQDGNEQKVEKYVKGSKGFRKEILAQIKHLEEDVLPKASTAEKKQNLLAVIDYLNALVNPPKKKK